MKWYYANGKHQVGPVNDTEFQAMVENGTVRHDTLVWNETMGDWAEYGKINSAGEITQVVPPIETPCCECKNTFLEEDMIQYEGNWVCASCKPVFVQKLKEGVQLSGTMAYAGFWIRAGAKIIDMFILWAIQTIVYIPLFAIIPSMAKSPGNAQDFSSLIIVQAIFSIIPIVLQAAYVTWFLGKFGATPGKMACRLKVVSFDGEKITYSKAFGRYFAEIISGLILGIGYILVAFDDQKRALHDHICNTRVVRK